MKTGKFNLLADLSWIRHAAERREMRRRRRLLAANHAVPEADVESQPAHTEAEHDGGTDLKDPSSLPPNVAI